MPLNTFSRDAADLIDFAARNPTPDLPPAFAQAWSASTEEARRFTSSDAQWRNRHEAVQRALDALEDATGEVYANPEAAPAGPNRDALVKAIRSRFDNLARERPDLGLRYPTDEEIEAGAVERARGARDAREAMSAANTTMAGRAGAFLGDLWGAGTDPLNLLTMPFGASAASGVLRTALVEGALSAASQAAIEAGTAGFKQQVDPTFSLGEAAANVGMAGAAGAVIGGGIRGAADLLALARGKKLAREGADAVNVLEREQHLGDTAPLPGVAGEVVHREALSRAAADLEAGRQPAVQDITSAAPAPPPNTGRVYTSAGRAVDVEYRVVEADSLVASHTAEGLENPAFPPELQPRDRTRVASQAQIAEMAGQLQPERLGRSPDAATGAPIVGPDMVVESGNGRALAIRTAYDAGGDAATRYRAFVEQQFPDAAGMQRPVLVAIRRTDLDPAGRVAFTGEANAATAARLSPTELALADARHLDDALMERFSGGEVSAASNRPFVRAFLDRLPAAERGALVDADGALNVEGARRVQGALLGRAYGDARIIGRIVEDADSDIRAIGGALLDVAGPWAKLRAAAARGDLAPGMDVTDDLLSAVRMVAEARSAGRNVRELADQMGLFGGELSPVGRAFLNALFRDTDFSKPAGRARVADALRSYVDEAVKNTSGPRLFGEPLTAEQILTGGGRATNEPTRPTARPINDNAPRPAEEMVAAKELDDALFHDVNRLLAERDLEVAVGETIDPETGRVVTLKRSAMDVMDDADKEIAEVEQLAACVFGMAAE